MKRITGLLLMLCLAGGLTLQVHAETFYGDSDWRVEFTPDSEMDSNFQTADLAEAVSGLQPGDSIIFNMNLKNNNGSATDWYMVNEVLYSLEDRSANSGTGGGAYTYILSYTDKNGEETTLFSSDTVGGESRDQGEDGLHGATEALEEYFYLDTLATGESGEIQLTIALDGETQGNDYQDTLADLRMNFAVETNTSETSPNPPGDTGSRTEIVKTGDEWNLVPLYIAMAASGALLLLLGIYSLKRSREEKKGGRTA